MRSAAIKRESNSAATPRPFSGARNVRAIYPAGFPPVIGAAAEDYSLAGGDRGADISSWALDFNLGYGRSAIDYTVKNTLNATWRRLADDLQGRRPDLRSTPRRGGADQEFEVESWLSR